VFEQVKVLKYVGALTSVKNKINEGTKMKIATRNPYYCGL
jgi:hypothetical protein